MGAPPFDLLIVSDGRPDLLRRCERALAAAAPGRVALQLRERGLSTPALLTLAHAAQELTQRYGAFLIINGPVELALAVNADGVHLPEQGLQPEEARQRLGSTAWIGASRHDAQGLARAAAGGADYATLSPVHPVAGKGPALGIARFGALARTATLPVYALGGVAQADVRALRDVGARGIAVMREVLSASDPGASTQRLLEALNVTAG